MTTVHRQPAYTLLPDAVTSPADLVKALQSAVQADALTADSPGIAAYAAAWDERAAASRARAEVTQIVLADSAHHPRLRPRSAARRIEHTCHIFIALRRNPQASLSELRASCELSSSTVQRAITTLVRAGLITRGPRGAARTRRPTE